VRGGEDLGETAGLCPVEVRRNGDGVALVHDGALALPAATDHRHLPVADREPGDAVAGPLHFAGELESRDVSGAPGRCGIEALPLHQVRAVDAGRPHGHQELALSRLRVGMLPPIERAVDDGYRTHYL